MCWVLSLVLWGQPLPGSWCVLGSSREAMTRLAGVRPILGRVGSGRGPSTAVLGRSLGHRVAVETGHGGGCGESLCPHCPIPRAGLRVTDVLCQAVPSHAEP